MRLFKIKNSGEFVEYKEQDFKDEHREHTLESWLENNPDSIIEDGKLLIIGRQVSTNFQTFIDLLALDKLGNTVVIELKRDRTPREAISQALEYTSFVEMLNYEQLENILQKYTENEGDNLLEHHRVFFELEDEAISFNKDQRIVIIGTNITPQIRQTAIFLRRKGIKVTCSEFKYFKTESGETLLSGDIVVGRERIGKPKKISTRSLPKIDEKKFLESLNSSGRPFFKAILQLSRTNNLPIRWGSKGFSLNVDIKGKYVQLFYGFPPESVYKQSFYTAFADVKKKIEDSAELIDSIRDRLMRTGIFLRAGNEIKCVIEQTLTENQINEIENVVFDFANNVKNLELIEIAS